MNEIMSIEDELINDFNYIIKNVPILYKYYDFNIGSKVLNEFSLKITHPNKFNDPYDCYKGLIDFSKPSDDFLRGIIQKNNPNFNRSEIRAKVKETKKDKNIFNIMKDQFPDEIIKYSRVACFSEIYNDILMWSHYSKDHKGFCIGFDQKKLYEYFASLTSKMSMFKVNYVEKFECLDYFKEKKRAFVNLIRTKSTKWVYEHEIRFFLDLYGNMNVLNNDIVYFNKDIIKSIYIGSKIDDEETDVIVQSCKKNLPNIKIFKMGLHETKFQLKTKEIQL